MEPQIFRYWLSSSKLGKDLVKQVHNYMLTKPSILTFYSYNLPDTSIGHMIGDLFTYFEKDGYLIKVWN
jgi:hypothetical protein